MAITFEQFFSAISEQESGGNYKARGPKTSYGYAYGKYQVLESNIPKWTKRFYGKSLTVQQFINNPQAQEIVAKGQLKAYWKAYGPRGAAAAWYGGEGSAHLHNTTHPQQGGPSFKEYVDSVLSKAAKYPAGGGPAVDTSTSGSAAGGDSVPKLSEAELREQYGFTASFLDANPEIKSLFKKLVSEGWTKEMFSAKLRNTKWWKTHTETERQYLTLRFTDPATAKQKFNQMKLRITQMASQMGMTLTHDAKKRIEQATYNAVAKGWDEGQLRYWLGQYVTFGHTLKGEGGEAIEGLREYAYNMGVSLSGQWYTARARNILRGIATEQDYKSEILNKAKASFPQWAKQLDAGQTVADIAQPYMQSMVQILEIAPGSVNLFDATIKKALNYTNRTSLQREAKPLWQFENELRGDPRWKKTKNAQDSLFQVGHQVLADFGFKY